MELGLQGSAAWAVGIHTATQPPFPRKQPPLQGTQREAAGGQQRPKQAHTGVCLCACVCVSGLSRGWGRPSREFSSQISKVPLAQSPVPKHMPYTIPFSLCGVF